MKMEFRTIKAAFISILLLAGCASAQGDQQNAQSDQQPKADAYNSELIACPSTRPEVCTFEFQPVCARKDTKIRCVTTPCPSEELVTYGNACSACSDPQVYGYIPGPCNEKNPPKQ